MWLNCKIIKKWQSPHFFQAKYWQWRIQRIVDAGISVWPPKSHLFKSQEIYIFFFPKSNQNCFHVMFQPVFTPCFALRSSVCFIQGYWFWCFLNLFTLEVIISRNILACVKNYLNVNVKTFPRGLDSILLTYRLPAIIWYLLCEKQFLQTKPWIRQWLNTNNIPSNDISMLRRACPSILLPVTNTYFSRKLTWWGNQKKML